MLYQFLDWRIGRGRKMLLVNAERCLARVRSVNAGTLPLYLETWEQFTAFAGEASIPLPEMEEVAHGLVAANLMYPTLAWVNEEYTKFLVYLASNVEYADLLKDPEPVASPLQFSELMEVSVSNVEGEPCLVPDPAISSPGSTPAGSPNSLSMGTKQYPRLLRPSTRMLVPSHLSARLKDE